MHISFELVFLFPSDKYQGVESLDSMVFLFLFFIFFLNFILFLNFT